MSAPEAELERDEVEPPEAPASAKAAGIAYNDRVLVVGYTGSGKSELLNVLWSGMRCQRLLVDSKEEWTVAGVEPARSAGELDWSQPILHYAGELGTVAEYDELFGACYRRRHLSVAVHELADLCEYRAAKAPRWLSTYLSKGRTHGLGMLGGSQRPYEMPVRAKTEAQHVIYVVPHLPPDDHETIARVMRMSTAELSELVDAAHERHGEHAFIWYDRGARDLSIWPALPDHIRARSIVTSRGVAA